MTRLVATEPEFLKTPFGEMKIPDPEMKHQED
jgi:hypothetical protein